MKTLASRSYMRRQRKAAISIDRKSQQPHKSRAAKLTKPFSPWSKCSELADNMEFSEM